MNQSLPHEYRKVAEALFPLNSLPSKKGTSLAEAADFAEALGIGSEYQRLLGIKKNAAEMRKFLAHFQNNLDLLIQKTWVEKADQERKEKLQDDVLPFMAQIEQGNFHQALEEFGLILEELAYLLFGPQCAKEDFTVYTFRIDLQMGLFWWYGSRLGSLKKAGKTGAVSDEILWAILLLGICYLT
ncbi:MAG: hypothetical protein LBU85_04915, partial [Treponema sp.]|nr:hypothetical protein [Treponema sp.]